MGIRSRFKTWRTRSAAKKQTIPEIPTRDAVAAQIGTGSAVRMASVYRAISVIATAASQLSITVERAGITLTGTAVPAHIRQPNLYMSRSDFVEQLVLALATTGNAFIKKTTTPDGTLIINLEPLTPSECLPVIDPVTGIKTVWWRGTQYGADQIQHLAFMSLPGVATGLGPIQAAQVELTAARDVRDFASKWFTETGQPAGVLTTEQEADDDTLHTLRNAWNYMDHEGKPIDMTANPSRVRVLSKGMSYDPILINPKDAQWIEARQFSTTEIARLFGVPAPLMLAAVEGSSQTYSNVEQEWIAFTRFTLTGYLRKIEEALTALTPHGQTVRFNIEALLRSDTKTRYEAHEIAIRTGLETIDEARAIEGRPPLTDADRAALTPSPAKDPANATV